MFKEKVTQVLDTSVFKKGSFITMVNMEWDDDGNLEPSHYTYNGLITASTEEYFTYISENGEYKQVPVERIYNINDPQHTAWIQVIGIAHRIERKM
jgi:hypothetical protein